MWHQFISYLRLREVFIFIFILVGWCTYYILHITYYTLHTHTHTHTYTYTANIQLCILVDIWYWYVMWQQFTPTLYSEMYSFLSLADGLMYAAHSLCTVICSWKYLVCDMTTVHTPIILRRVFFLIFSWWIDIWHT